MSILRNSNVALSNLRYGHVTLSNLINCPVPCHYLLKTHVTKPQKTHVTVSILGVKSHKGSNTTGTWGRGRERWGRRGVTIDSDPCEDEDVTPAASWYVCLEAESRTNQGQSHTTLLCILSFFKEDAGYK